MKGECSPPCDVCRECECVSPICENHCRQTRAWRSRPNQERGPKTDFQEPIIINMEKWLETYQEIVEKQDELIELGYNLGIEAVCELSLFTYE